MLALASFYSGVAQGKEPQPIDRQHWITIEDNLPEATRLDLDGTVLAELSVSTTGQVTECRVLESSGHSLLDDHTCRLLNSRARFTPATDDNGRAIPSTFRHPVKWQLVTRTNWAKNGLVRAATTIVPGENYKPGCSSETYGEMSDYMKQMACFVLVNMVQKIPAEKLQDQKGPRGAVFVLEVYPEAAGAPSASPKESGKRIAHTSAILFVNARGMRTDCRMLETSGSADLIFPSCAPSPLFEYSPLKDSKGANVPTTFRQDVSYYLVDP